LFSVLLHFFISLFQHKEKEKRSKEKRKADSLTSRQKHAPAKTGEGRQIILLRIFIRRCIVG